MTTTMFVFIVALSFVAAGTPVIRRTAHRIGFLDHPSSRKLQKQPIPLMGGIAIYAGVLLSILLFGRHYLPELISILAGATLLSLLGLWDDRMDLPATVKLLGQIAAAAGLVLAGVQIQLGWVPDWLNICLTIVWVVGISNTINLIDNMDGLAGGISAVAAAFFMVIAAMNGQYLVSAFSSAIFGACLGFLIFNSQPATIFMGDAGALFLGFTLAVIGIKLRFPENTNIVTWLVPVLVLGVPIFDTTLVMISRILRRVNPFTTAGKDHIPHRLVSRGMTQREAVFTLYLAGCFLGLLAIFVMQANPNEAYTVAIAVVIVGGFAIRQFERKSTKESDG